VSGVEEVVRTIRRNDAHIIKDAAGICFLAEGAIWNEVRFDERVVREVILCFPTIETAGGIERGCGAKTRTGVGVGTEDCRRAGGVFGDNDRRVGDRLAAALPPGNRGTGLRRKPDINRLAGVVGDADIAGRRRREVRLACFLGDSAESRIRNRQNLAGPLILKLRCGPAFGAYERQVAVDTWTGAA